MAIATEQEAVMSRDDLGQTLVPWFGRRYERWLRHQVHPDPIDPLVVRIPNQLYEEYRRRPKMSPLTQEQKRRLGVQLDGGVPKCQYQLKRIA